MIVFALIVSLCISALLGSSLFLLLASLGAEERTNTLIVLIVSFIVGVCVYSGLAGFVSFYQSFCNETCAGFGESYFDSSADSCQCVNNGFLVEHGFVCNGDLSVCVLRGGVE